MNLGTCRRHRTNPGISSLWTYVSLKVTHYISHFLLCILVSLVKSILQYLYNIIVWELSKDFNPVGQLANKNGISDQMFEGNS